MTGEMAPTRAKVNEGEEESGWDGWDERQLRLAATRLSSRQPISFEDLDFEDGVDTAPSPPPTMCGRTDAS